MKRGRITGVTGRQSDLRDIMRKLEIPQHLMPLVTPYMMFLPQSTDWAAQGVHYLVEGIQRALQRKNFRVKVDGDIGAKTAEGLHRISGPQWTQKTWMQLAADVIHAKPFEGEPMKTGPVREPAQGGEAALGGFVGEILWSPIGLVGAGLVAWHFLWRKR